VKEVMSNYYECNTFDIKQECTCDTLRGLVTKSDVIFVCVPTPMNRDGSCNTDIVEDVISDINDAVWIDRLNHNPRAMSHNPKTDKIVVIKSTVPPGTTERLNKENDNVTVIFNPEFLTEANFIEDFKNQDRIIIGGDRPATTKVRQMFSVAFPETPIVKTGSTTAEMVKYMTNSFLATKVSFANEIKLICDKLDIDYDKVVEYATYDERLGKSHWSVPGPDGHGGFGGSCFPKDLNALIKVAESMDLEVETLRGAWQTNLEVRPECDWNELKGRAVVE
jgi:UDPglucose 6-dehydrogenase